MPLAVEARDVEAGDVVLVLVTLTHPDFSAPVRVVANGADIVSRGNTFVGVPVEVRFPSAGERADWAAMLRIENVEIDIVTAMKASKTRAEVTIEVVMSDAPDSVEVSLADFVLSEVNAGAEFIEGALTPPVLDTEPACSIRFTPGRAPGMF